MTKVPFNDREVYDIVLFLKEKIPMIYDMDDNELKFKTNNMYYKIYRYIKYLREKIKELEEE